MGTDQGVSWNSVRVNGSQELALVNLVGPLMRKKHPHLKMMIHDDQVYSLKSRLVQEGAGILSSQFVDGVAFHWYGSFGAIFENTTADHLIHDIPLGPKDFGGGIQVKEIYDTY